ncbi:MAG: hypothetical protein WDW38_010982 [Sanguina aurantia]
MYKRDVAIVLLSFVAILVSLQHEGSFSYRKAWYHHLTTDGDELYVTHHEMPAPVVADLNGDGNLELVLATPDLKLQVVRPQDAGRAADGFAQATLLQEVSLLHSSQHGVSMAAVQRVVSLSVGYLDPLPAERVLPPRKQVIVAVTAGWQVLCYDHNLKLLWQHDARETFPRHSHIKEVAVYISPHQVHPQDRGLVVIGASMAHGDLSSGDGLEATASTTAAGAAKGGDAGKGGRLGRRLSEQLTPTSFGDGDVFMGELLREEEEQVHAKSAGAGEPLQDLDAGAEVRGVDTSRHFDYLALDGGSGSLRWHHGSSDFHKDLGELSEELRPQMDYRLDAAKLEGRHFGEASCRDFRSSLMHVLPHSWGAAADTRLVGAHFVKHKLGRGPQKAALAGRGKGGGQRGGSEDGRAGGDGSAAHGAGHSLVGGLHSLLHGTARTAQRHRAGQHTQLDKHGNIVNPHASERDPREDERLGPSDRAQDVGRGAERLQQHHASRHNVSANALVAFLEEGIEVLHLYTGRTLCKLHLLPHTLHADFNGDGVVDHVTVAHGLDDDDASGSGISSTGGVQRVARLRGHRHQRHPTQGEPLHGGSVPVCRSRQFGASSGIFQRSATGPARTEFATPIMLPIPELSRGFRSRAALTHGMLVFLSSKGEMTAVSSSGEPLWQLLFHIPWPASSPGGGPQSVVPTLAPLPLHTHAVPSAILAAGSSGAVVVSEHGHLLESIEFPFPPTQPLLVADCTGDGLNDIILVTARGVYGYQQVQHLGGLTMSTLLLTLIMCMVLVYFSQQGSQGFGGYGSESGSSKRGPRLRSTDYTD